MQLRKIGVPAPRSAVFWAAALIFGLLAWNVLSSLYMMWAFAAPWPYWDQWDAAYFPNAFLQQVFSFHSEHRPALARIIGLADWYLADGRNGLNIAFIALCYPLFALALFRLIRMTGVGNRKALLFTALAMTIQASAEQYENLLWGFQTAFVGSFAFAALAAALAATAARSQAPLRVAILYALCLASSLVSVFALASGLLTLVGVTVLLFVVDAPRPLKFSYPIFALAVAAFYLHGYSSPSGHSNPLQTIGHPLAVVHYVLIYLGAPFAHDSAADEATLIGGCGAVLFAGVAADALRLTLRDAALWRMRAGTAYVTLLILATTIVGAAAMAGLGRMVFGLGQAMASRYGAPALAFWADLIVLCLVRVQLQPKQAQAFWTDLIGRRGPVRLRVQVPRALRWGGVALGLLLAIFVAFHQSGYVSLARRLHAERLSGSAAMVLGLRDAPAFNLYPANDPRGRSVVDAGLDEMAAQRKSIFADGWPQRLGTPLRVWTGTPQGRCGGFVDGRTSLTGEKGAVVQLTGWALLDHGRRKSNLVVFTDNQDTIVGFGAPGYQREDVSKALHNSRATFSGWVGYAKGGPGTTLHAYGVTITGGAAKACQFAVSGG